MARSIMHLDGPFPFAGHSVDRMTRAFQSQTLAGGSLWIEKGLNGHVHGVDSENDSVHGGLDKPIGCM